MNAYWDVVKPYVVDGVIRRDGFDHYEAWADGMRMRYSWTVTDPATVEFVRAGLGGASQDPFGGTGWWKVVLAEQRRGLWCFDLRPPAQTWAFVDAMDALDSITVAPRLPLLLAWPPRYDPIGEKVVRAYRGNRIVHMGAVGRTSDGTDEMRALLAKDWHQVAQHTPVRWFGVQDYVTVYERN